MKVLMLGWEFPPFFAGGVGVVCHSLTMALARRGVDITYVMPTAPESVTSRHVRLVVASQVAPHVNVRRLEASLLPYQAMAPSAPAPAVAAGRPAAQLYGGNLREEIERFAAQAAWLVRTQDIDFDVIHAHDWTTFSAGLAVKRVTGKPLIVHVHITEFDKTGGEHADPATWAMERAGLDGADLVVPVSRRIGKTCVERYFTDPDKVRVVHNGVERWAPGREASPWAPAGRRSVLFLGRVTLQKGPDHFLAAARRVLDLRRDVNFVLAGSGDMLPRMIERAAELGIAEHVVFAGFVDRDEALRLYRQADVYVMPSVSEPFGVAPLEAMTQGVPVIVSRQSGVAEVVRHAIKVDFWDTEDLAAKIVAALSYPSLAGELRDRGRAEAAGLNWDAVAERMIAVYREAAGRTLVGSQ